MLHACKVGQCGSISFCRSHDDSQQIAFDTVCSVTFLSEMDLQFVSPGIEVKVSSMHFPGSFLQPFV